MRRRKYLAAVGLTAGTMFAGCSGETGSNNSSNESGGSSGNSSGSSGNSEETEASGGSEAAETAQGLSTTNGMETSMPTSMSDPSPATTMESSGMGTMMSTSMSGGGNADVSIDSSELSQESSSGITDTAIIGELTAPAYLSSIELQARFRNDAGDVVDTNSAYFQGLEEGQTWNFYVPSLATDPPAEGEVEIASATPGSTPSADGVELVESSLNEPADEYSGPTVTGRAENTSGSSISYLEAQVVFLSDDGIALDSDWTNVSDLPDGETWSFEVEQITFSTDPRPDASDHIVRLATGL